MYFECDLTKAAQEVARTVDQKQRAYGDAFSKCAEFMDILYPDGISPDQYTDALCLVRIFDKMMRIATAKDAFGESPYRDICGYALLGAMKDAPDQDPTPNPDLG